MGSGEPKRRHVRRAELVHKTRQPAPPGYDLTPHNRQQRRRLAQALRRQDKRGPRGDE